MCVCVSTSAVILVELLWRYKLPWIYCHSPACGDRYSERAFDDIQILALVLFQLVGAFI